MGPLNTTVGLALGLGPLPVIGVQAYEGHPDWKFGAVGRFAYGRPLAWLDDDVDLFPRARERFLSRRRVITALIPVDPHGESALGRGQEPVRPRPDGALPNAFVPNTSAQDWQVLFDLVSARGWRWECLQGKTALPFPFAAEAFPRPARHQAAQLKV